MSNARDILAEVKAKRHENQRLDQCNVELRKPWHAPFWILASQLPWLYIVFTGFDRKHLWSILSLMAVAGFSVVSFIAHMRQRDKMWRELVSRTNPDLAREIDNRS